MSKWIEKYWVLVVGVLVLVVTIGSMRIIWSNVNAFEETRKTEHIDFVNKTAQTLESFLNEENYESFREMFALLTQLDVVKYIGFFKERQQMKHAGKDHKLNMKHLLEVAPRDGRTYLDQKSQYWYMDKKLGADPKRDEYLKIAISMEAFDESKQGIHQAFIVIIILLGVLVCLGLYLFQVLKKLKSTEKTKKDMIYGITHDAKQDLFVIEGKLGTVLKNIAQKKPVPTLEKDLKSAHESAESIDRFLNNLNDHEKLNTGEIQMLLDDVDVIDSVNSVVHAVDEAISKRDMRIDVMTTLKTCMVIADEQLLKRILKNLVHNAIKFSALDTCIEISIGTFNGNAQISVSDQGPGIAQQDWGKVFQPFVKLQSKKEGMGLGLATSRKLSSLLGGGLFIEKSTLGVGTTFTFTLPLVKR